MIKNIMALVGIGAVLAGVVIWQFGFFSRKVDETMLKMDRATVVSRAESKVREIEKRAEEINAKARKLRIDAKAMELGIERQNQEYTVLESAIKTLADEAKKAGFPKPSEQATLTPEQKKKTLSIGGKTIHAPEIYSTLTRWSEDLERKKGTKEMNQSMIEKMNSVADQLQNKRSEMLAAADKVQGRIKELEMQRDLAKINTELTELGANLEGVNSGELGNMLSTLQKEIDELDATSFVLQNEKKETTPLTPESVVKPQSVNTNTSLDSLWK